MRISGSYHIVALATCLGLAQADWQYRSRPDLAPPRLNVTIPATDKVNPGYVFVGPYPGFDGVRAGPEQPAAYIFTNDGDLVWSSLGYFSGWIGNFQVVTYQGKKVLQAFQGALDSFHGHGYGAPMMLDDHYRPVETVQALNHRLISIHEFQVVNEKTALVEIYQPTAIDLTPYGGKEDESWIADGVFQEFDIETGHLIFEGHSLDWASPADSVIPLRSGRAFTGVNASDAWDYFHINSVDKNDQGDYLVSARHMSAIYKINGTSGEKIWQVGGAKSDFELLGDLDFGYQHDARFLNQSSDGSIEIISFFDNSARSDRQRAGGVDLLHPHSRARVIEINHNDGTASEYNTFIPPDNISTWSQGNVQVLESQNVFVNWGQSGAVTEFSPSGEVIYHAYLDSGHLAPGVQSYRGFRCEWTGHSRETPSVVAYTEDGEGTIYVSWNGDTVTKSWRFYQERPSAGRSKAQAVEIQLLGEVERKSFETYLTVPVKDISHDGKVEGIFVQAIDEHGEVLATSASIGINGFKRPSGPATAVSNDERLFKQQPDSTTSWWRSLDL
jgi:hypothetical protein